MRSRFFLGHPEILDLPPTSTSTPAVTRALTSPAGRRVSQPVVKALSRFRTRDRLGHALLHHCATEMNHLATFLPNLYTEFRDTP